MKSVWLALVLGIGLAMFSAYNVRVAYNRGWDDGKETVIKCIEHLSRNEQC